MSEKTWILLTDGYYIKLLYISENDSTLKTYREADFDNSSEITYSLITRYKIDHSGNQTQPHSEDVETTDYTLKTMSGFLESKLEENAFGNLVILGPDEVLTALENNFSTDLLNTIRQKISGDYMNSPLDKLQEIIAKASRKE